MEKIVHVFFDNSGSMAEYAKLHIQHNAARTFITMKEMYADFFSNIKFAFYTVNEHINSLSPNEGGIFKFSKPEGNLDISLISEKIQKIHEDSIEEKVSVIIFSDGLFGRRERKLFAENFKNTKWLYIQCVGIGIDKDTLALKELSSSNRVETVDNIYSFIEDAVCFLISSNKKPLSVNDIKKMGSL